MLFQLYIILSIDASKIYNFQYVNIQIAFFPIGQLGIRKLNQPKAIQIDSKVGCEYFVRRYSTWTHTQRSMHQQHNYQSIFELNSSNEFQYCKLSMSTFEKHAQPDNFHS